MDCKKCGNEIVLSNLISKLGCFLGRKAYIDCLCENCYQNPEKDFNSEKTVSQYTSGSIFPEQENTDSINQITDSSKSKCVHCGSEWNIGADLKKPENCPFCGKNLISNTKTSEQKGNYSEREFNNLDEAESNSIIDISLPTNIAPMKTFCNKLLDYTNLKRDEARQIYRALEKCYHYSKYDPKREHDFYDFLTEFFKRKWKRRDQFISKVYDVIFLLDQERKDKIAKKFGIDEW